MGMRELIPWGRGNNKPAPVPSAWRDNERDPFMTLHREMNRLFDDVFRSFDMTSPLGRMGAWPSGWSAGWPSVEVSETEKEVRVRAEVPGMEEKDIEVLLEDGVLTLRGEKKAETEDKDRQFSEHFYGQFERRVPLGIEIEEDKVAASFKNGVLTVTLPKTARAQAKARKIAINGKS